MVDQTSPETEGLSRDSLQKLKKNELVTLARLTYGLNIHMDEPKETMVRLIMNAARTFKGNAEMTVVNMNEEVEVPKGYVKVRVSPGDYNPKGRPIPIGLNFRLATIPCNKDVVMHGKWLPCLQDAVATVYSVQFNPERGKDELVAQEQHRYPFSLLVDNR